VQDLELSAAEASAMVDAVMGHIVQAIGAVGDGPVDTSSRADSDYLARMLEAAPEEGSPLAPLLDRLFGDYARRSLDPTSPGFMGYVPGGGIFHAAVADLIADTLNRYVGVSAVAGAYVQIENNVLRWFSEIVGYGADSGGYLTSGGSLANWGAIVAARETRLDGDLARGVIYTSDQAHHCVAKAARLAGIPPGNVRVLASDAFYRLQPGAVCSAVDEDLRAGMRPFLLVASAGTTNTGAVDPLDALADVAEELDLWFHVDGAYGGFFQLTERGRAVLAGLSRADSVALDPHKTLFLPYGTGALLVRQRRTLRQAHATTADYLPPPSAEEEVPDFSDLSPELTRPFRGLRVWLPLKLHGLGVFRAYLDEKLDLARWLAAELQRMPEVEVLASPELSILAFALRASDIEAANARTRLVLAAVNKRNRVMLTGTMLRGRFVIRVAVVSYRTHQQHLQLLLDDLREAIVDMQL
jgi:aromatic-L-amino-acid decarboxylase